MKFDDVKNILAAGAAIIGALLSVASAKDAVDSAARGIQNSKQEQRTEK